MDNCKFTWFNIPNKIKDKIKPYNNILSKEAKNIHFFNLPKKLNLLYKELSDLKPGCAIGYVNFMWFNLPNKVKAICDIVACEEPLLEINFDVEADNWINEDIIDEVSFISFLETQGATNVITTDFSLTEGRLQCHLTFGGTTELYFNSLGITKINNLDALSDIIILEFYDNKISTIENLESLTNLEELTLGENQISTIENLESLTSLTKLYLYQNQISTIENIQSLTNLEILDLSGNQISTIENIETLTNLKELYLYENQISVIENIDNLTNLERLDLSTNQIATIQNVEDLVNLEILNIGYNEITVVENLQTLTNLKELLLPSNQISEIEDVELSTNIVNFDLSQNLFTTADYTNTETWATTQTFFTNPCIIYFELNPDTPVGTNFETIINSKNVTLIY